MGLITYYVIMCLQTMCLADTSHSTHTELNSHFTPLKLAIYSFVQHMFLVLVKNTHLTVKGQDKGYRGLSSGSLHLGNSTVFNAV